MFQVTNESNETIRFDLPSRFVKYSHYHEAAIEAHRLIGGSFFRVVIEGEPDGFPIRHYQTKGQLPVQGAEIIGARFVPHNLR